MKSIENFLQRTQRCLFHAFECLKHLVGILQGKKYALILKFKFHIRMRCILLLKKIRIKQCYYFFFFPKHSQNKLLFRSRLPFKLTISCAASFICLLREKKIASYFIIVFLCSVFSSGRMTLFFCLILCPHLSPQP